MFRLYIDEDSADRNLVRGVDVITAQEAEMIERTDDEHLQFATSRNRVLLRPETASGLRTQADVLSKGGPV